MKIEIEKKYHYEDIKKMCDKIGLITFADVVYFKEKMQEKILYVALKNYIKELDQEK